jgi:multiple sugar transport system permease protein
MSTEKTTSHFKSVFFYLALLLGAVVMFLPFYWTMITSVMFPEETNHFPIIWIPTKVTLKWLIQAWSAKFPLYYLNSTIIAAVVVLSNVYTSAMAGFIFAKYKFPLKNTLFIIILATMMVPGVVTIIPAYYIVTVIMHLKNTLWAMIIPALISPFGIFLMRQFTESIPDELLDASKIDGAGDFRTFWQIVLPLCAPALSANAIFHFIWIWNDFLWPLLVTDSDKARTLPVGLALFASPRWLQTNLVVSGSLLVLLPMVIIYFIFQRAFVQGIVLTGLKY